MNPEKLKLAQAIEAYSQAQQQTAIASFVLKQTLDQLLPDTPNEQPSDPTNDPASSATSSPVGGEHGSTADPVGKRIDG